MHWRKRMNVSSWLLNKLQRMSPSLGHLLLIISASILALSGCAEKPLTVRPQVCECPQPPAELLKPPANLDWVRPELLPKSN